jgi:hypothetical protein
VAFETLTVRQEGAVLFADIAAPPMNLLGPEMVRDLVSLIQRAEADDAVRVLVFKSADPDYFISHVDVTRIGEYRQEAKLTGEASIGLLFRHLSASRLVTKRHAYDQLDLFYKNGLGYAQEMSHRPQTLYGVDDSPVGLAAWMLDHDARSYELMARVFAGRKEGLTPDDILDNVTLYWLTNTGVSSARLYWESKLAFFAPKGIAIPVAVSAFPDELYQAPRSWTERAYPKLVYYNKPAKGGHFAAWEQPELLPSRPRGCAGRAGARRDRRSVQVLLPDRAPVRDERDAVLMTIVPLDSQNIWVTANFKETQLRHMRPGQPARVYVDTYGRTYDGRVQSISGASGARYSLLPPENATGNYVKVVQRIAVKIVFDKGQDPEHLLRPGMSVEPDVRVR